MIIQAITFLIFVFSCFIWYTTTRSHACISKYTNQRGENEMMIYVSVLLIGSLFWPIVFYLIVGWDNIFERIPFASVALIWPIVLCGIQLYDIYHDHLEDIQDLQSKRVSIFSGIQADTSTIVSFSFAIATILWVLGDKQNLVPSAKLVVVVLLFCMAFILPIHQFVDNNQTYALVTRAFQRILMNYMTGLILMSLITVLTSCFRREKEAIVEQKQ